MKSFFRDWYNKGVLDALIGIMIKRGAILLLLFALCSTAVRAYDFAVAVPSGQTLYFSHVQGGVQVVYPNANNTPANGWVGFARPTGALTVPATVTYADTTYSVLSVGNHAFFECVGLTAVTLAEGITSVGNSSIRGCTALTSIALPSTLESIGNFAFTDCTALTDVWVNRPTPPATGDNIFYNITLSACTLHVACNAIAAYMGVQPWSSFGSMVDAGCTVTINALVNNSARGTVSGGGSYPAGTQVMLTAQPAAGCIFVCWNDGDTLNPRIVNAVADTTFTAMFFPWHPDTVTMVVVVHDTLYQTDTVYLAEPVHDTVAVHDTLYPTFFTLSVLSDNSELGVGVGSAVLPAGTEAEVCALPLEVGRFVAWADGPTDNPRRVTLTGNTSLTALFERLTVTEAGNGAWTMTSEGRRLTVSCRVGETLKIYDVQGRCHLAMATTADRTTLVLPSAGVWLVQVGDGAARKMVVK